MTIQRAMDVSSHQPKNLTQLLQDHAIEHCIVRIYLPWETPPFDHTIAQVQSARANGVTVGGYAWAYRSVNPEATIKAVIERCAQIDLELPLLWLDCETYENDQGQLEDEGPDADWLSRAVALAEDVYQMKCGLYTGLWWIQGHFPGGEAEFSNFSRLPIWLSDYDNNPDVTATELPLGWSEAAAKQYTDTPVDLDSIRSEYTLYAPAPPPPADPCADITAEHERMLAGLDSIINRKPFKTTKKELIAVRGPQ